MKYLVSLLLLSLSYFSFSQNPTTAVFYEALGTGVFYSVNLEQKFTGLDQNGLKARVGIAKRNVSGVDLTSVPLSAAYSFHLGKSGSHYMELGGGYTYLNNFEEGLEIKTLDLNEGSFASGVVAYRYVPNIERGIFGRAAFTPLFTDNTIMYGGVSAGYIF